MKRLLTGLTSAAVLSLAAIPAQASLVVGFYQNTGFTEGTAVDEDNNTGVNAAIEYGSSTHGHDGYMDAHGAMTYDTITWGDDATYGTGVYNWDNSDRSGLQFLGQEGSVTDGGGWATITELHHMNNPITRNSLTSVLISSVLELSIDGIPLFDDPAQSELLFTESSNREPCDDPGDVGSVCPDEFTVDASGFAPLGFAYDGEWYKLEFQMVAVSNATVLVEGTDQIVWTREDDYSQVDVQMRLVKAPEPETLLMMSAALFGIAFRSRRQRK